MAYQAVLFICIQALFIQSISAQCLPGAYGGIEGLGFGAEALARGSWGLPGPLAAPCAGPLALDHAPFVPTASYGGGFAVTSSSPIIPTGISVTSENVYDGALAVTGKLPFLSAVSLEGSLPSLGVGAVTYGCGNGNVAIVNEDVAPVGYGAPLGYGAPVGYGAPLGYGAGVAPGIGYNGLGYGGCGSHF